MELGFAGVTGIVVICYLLAQAVKATSVDNKWLPIICGIFGGILGILGMFSMPDFPAEDLITAAAVGIASGLSATGVNQIYKQFTEK